jgi:cytochrome c-type biogenesis protein CcmI
MLAAKIRAKMAKSPENEVESLKAQLRRIEDLASKGLLRAEEAEEARTALRKRLLEALMPAEPAPRIPWRTRLWALGAMIVLVGSVAAYLMSGHAGLRRLSEQLLDEGKASVAKRAAAREETFEKLRASKAAAAASEGALPASAAGPAASAPASAAVATTALLDGRVALSPALAARVAREDALFIVVRLPEDPTGLPLAALRRQAGDLPLDFAIEPRDLVGDPARFAQARSVVVSARISKSGGGQPRKGDLTGEAPAVAPHASGVVVLVDRVVPGP